MMPTGGAEPTEESRRREFLPGSGGDGKLRHTFDRDDGLREFREHQRLQDILS